MSFTLCVFLLYLPLLSAQWEFRSCVDDPLLKRRGGEKKTQLWALLPYMPFILAGILAKTESQHRLTLDIYDQVVKSDWSWGRSCPCAVSCQRFAYMFLCALCMKQDCVVEIDSSQFTHKHKHDNMNIIELLFNLLSWYHHSYIWQDSVKRFCLATWRKTKLYYGTKVGMNCTIQHGTALYQYRYKSNCVCELLPS